MCSQFGSTVLHRYCKLQLKRSPQHTHTHLCSKRFSNILNNGSWCIPKSNQVESLVGFIFVAAFGFRFFGSGSGSPHHLTENPRNEKTRRIWILFFFGFWSMATSAPTDHTKYKIPKPVGPYHVPSGQLPPPPTAPHFQHLLLLLFLGSHIKSWNAAAWRN